MSFSRTDEDKNAAVEGSAALLNDGFIKIYSGTPPADVDTVLSGNDELAEGGFSLTAFGTASGGSVNANAISDGIGTAAAGVGTNATFARTFKSDGITATRQSKVFPKRAAKATVAAVVDGFDDSGDDLFTEVGVGDSINLTGFTNTNIDGDYVVVGKTDNGTIQTFPAPVATEAQGASVTMTPYGAVLDNISIAQDQTVTFSTYTISSYDLSDLG